MNKILSNLEIRIRESIDKVLVDGWKLKQGELFNLRNKTCCAIGAVVIAEKHKLHFDLVLLGDIDNQPRPMNIENFTLDECNLLDNIQYGFDHVSRLCKNPIDQPQNAKELGFKLAQDYLNAK